MNTSKISIIGAGFVGATAAHWIASRDLGQIILLDIQDGIPQGKALDLLQSSPIARFSSRVIGTNDYKDTSDSDVVVITAGMPRKPGMSRDELLGINAKIVKEVTQNVAAYSPKSILIVATNPLDAMVYAAWKASGFESKRVIGMAGVLDSSRMRTFIACELGVAAEDVSALVLGGHGDTMVPLMRHATVGGAPVSNLLSKEKLDAIVQRTRDGGAEIVNLLKTGSAYYAPAAALMEMVESILKDKKRVLPCAAYLNGEYGASGFFIGVPVVLGKDGVEKIIEVALNEEEKRAFDATVSHVKSLVAALEGI